MGDAAQTHPWLATSYAWSNGGKTVTFDLRHNVKWTDGTPFTSADVAYTFNLIKSNEGLNQSALPITGAVTAMPYFWLALLLLYLFAVVMRVLPLSGGYDPTLTIGWSGPFIASALQHAILPAAMIVLA